MSGFEFDWLVIDKKGHLAIFETAGFGEIPDTVLEIGQQRIEQYSNAIENLLKLPVITTYEEENQGVGNDTTIKAYAQRGIFIFDWVHWSGPYVRVLRPFKALNFESAKPLFPSFDLLIPRIDLEFSKVKSVDISNFFKSH